MGVLELTQIDGDPEEPSKRRYERQTPGELLHLVIKKLARFTRPGHRVMGDVTQCSSKPAITHYMWRSTTIHGLAWAVQRGAHLT